MKELLDLMIKDMNDSDELFKPTNFWTKGIKGILSDLNNDEDFLKFRQHKSANFMYVPTYDHSLYKKYGKIINRIFKVNYTNKPKPEIEGLFGTLSGYNKAKSDYRVFKASETSLHPNISDVSESLVGSPKDYYYFDSKNYSNSFLNYLLGINFLKKNVQTTNLKSVFEIGGGYGTLGEILLKSDENFFYLNVDIPPVASVSTYYLSEVFGAENVLSYEQSRNMEIIDIEELKKKYKCVVLCPWQLKKLKGKFDLFVNFMSFQEMEPHIVKNYISIVEKHTSQYILLRNSLSGKKVATNDDEIGVIDITKTSSMYEMFKEFSLVKKDHKSFGHYSNKFVSEISCLTRHKL